MTFRKDDLSQDTEYKALCRQENDLQKQLALLQQELAKIIEKKSTFENRQRISDEDFDVLLSKKLPALGKTKSLTDTTRGVVEITFLSDVSIVTVRRQLTPYVSDISTVEKHGFDFSKKLRISFKLSEKDTCAEKLQKTDDKPSINLKSYY